MVLLPESVSTYISTDGGDFLLTRPQGRIALSHVQVSEAKFLFVDHHQVLDRHWEECALTTERIPPQNLEVLRHLKEDSAGQRWIFVLSYVHSDERLESVVQQWNRAEAQDLISGIIFTREPLVKVAVIQTFLDSLGDRRGDRETAILVDDKVEIIEHLRQTFDPEEVKGVHIKLKRKRQSEGCDEYVQANFLLITLFRLVWENSYAPDQLPSIEARSFAQASEKWSIWQMKGHQGVYHWPKLFLPQSKTRVCQQKHRHRVYPSLRDNQQSCTGMSITKQSIISMHLMSLSKTIRLCNSQMPG